MTTASTGVQPGPGARSAVWLLPAAPGSRHARTSSTGSSSTGAPRPSTVGETISTAGRSASRKRRSCWHAGPWCNKFSVSGFVTSWLLVTALANSGEAATRRALLVGIDKYRPAMGQTREPASTPGRQEQVVSAKPAQRAPAFGRGTWTDLDGAVNDAIAFKELLVARFGFRATDIILLTNAEATREGILGAFRKHLVEQAQRDDVALFFYAGHGSRVRNSRTDEPDGMDEALVPEDSYKGMPDIRDKELSRLFNVALDKGVSLTVIADSCHSGSIARGLPRPGKYRYLPPDYRDVADPPDGAPHPEERGALVFSAAQDDQLAGEMSDDSGNSHGAFSLALFKTLQTASPTMAAQDVFLKVKALMQSEGRMQEPVIAGIRERRQMPLAYARDHWLLHPALRLHQRLHLEEHILGSHGGGSRLQRLEQGKAEGTVGVAAVVRHLARQLIVLRGRENKGAALLGVGGPVRGIGHVPIVRREVAVLPGPRETAGDRAAMAAVRDHGEANALIEGHIEEPTELLVTDVRHPFVRVLWDEGLVHAVRFVGAGVAHARAVPRVKEEGNVVALGLLHEVFPEGSKDPFPRGFRVRKEDDVGRPETESGDEQLFEGDGVVDGAVEVGPCPTAERRRALRRLRTDHLLLPAGRDRKSTRLNSSHVKI